MADDTRRGGNGHANDSLLFGYDAPALEMRIAHVVNEAPLSGANGLVVRPVGTATVDTELPATALLADNVAVPTTPMVGAVVMGYDGATIDLIRGESVNGLDVDVTRMPASTAGATTQVADTGSNVTLIAAGTRKGVSIQNTSSAALCIKTGATATTADFTVRLVQYAYWEAPYGYSGRIDGIWESDPNDGGAKITEYT